METTTLVAPTPSQDPLLVMPPGKVREGDWVILHFADGRLVFAQATSKAAVSVRINKKSYPTHNLIGLPYGIVLEQSCRELIPLPPTETKLIPDFPVAAAVSGGEDADEDAATVQEAEDSPKRDNRHLLDNNTAQTLDQQALLRLRESGTEGSAIVEKIIESSSTFEKKTFFSKAKYVARKQMKYQPRCRLTRCTGASICEALFLKDPKRLMNMREDTLAQILSYSNVSAGCQTLVLETCLGVVTGAVAQRMGGYGKILSIYSGQQHSYLEMLQKFNLSFAENASIKWLHAGDAFGDDDHRDDGSQSTDKIAKSPEEDSEALDRDIMEWPCALQDHTRQYIEREVKDPKRLHAFLAKRSNRFFRKKTRHTHLEAKKWLLERPCESLIIVARYDPTETLQRLLPYLAPSSPFVVYSEFVEPLTECFRELQEKDLAINLRLSDTWTREFQILPGRTRPVMDMSQSGGFILTGVKLHPVMGQNELDEELLKDIRAERGGRRGKKKKRARTENGEKAGSPKKRHVAEEPKTTE